MSKPIVYFTREITPDSLVKICNRLDKKLSGRIGVKISTGEPGGHNYLKPELIGKLVSSLNANIIECNTAYDGRRNTLAAHLQAIKEHGFDKIAEHVKYLGEKRESLAYDMDGAVVKVNSISGRGVVGEGTSTPKWAVAYKYPPEEKPTKLLSIDIQVGRTGVLTPTANLAPVRLAGTVVQRATLHNINIIRDRDIRIGDTVIVRKAGEIIPEILGSVKEARDGSEQVFEMPKVCPSCGHEVVRDDSGDGVAIRCVYPGCPAQNARAIVHFASKSAMNIEGVGPQVVELLLAEGLISDIADLYTLKADKIENLDRMGKKSAENIQINRSSSCHRKFFSLCV